MRIPKNFLPKKLSKEGLQKLLHAKEQDERTIDCETKQKISQALDSFKKNTGGIFIIIETWDEDMYKEISETVKKLVGDKRKLVMYNYINSPSLITFDMLQRFKDPEISAVYISQETEKIERERCEQSIFDVIYNNAIKVYI